MKHEELKVVISSSVALAFGCAIIYLYFIGNSLELQSIWKALSYGITLSTGFWTFFMTIGWKWKILNLVFYRPDLNGTWSGVIISDWKDKEGKTKPPIPFYLVIRQSFLRLHITTFTTDFVGVSYSESWSLKKHKGLKNISYLYRKDTSQYGDFELQEGAAELRLIEGELKALEGKYWSSRKTNGSIKVSWISKKYIDSFEMAKKLEA
jgi:hypothetical protein